MNNLLGHGTWVAVCDGRKALLLENKGDAALPNLKARDVMEQENPPTHLQGTAPPGRIFSSQGNRRGATEQTDFHDQAEHAFLRKVAERLDIVLNDEHIRALVLVAPARALGMLRPMLSAGVQKVLVAELDRDYVKLPLHQIENHLKHLG